MALGNTGVRGEGRKGRTSESGELAKGGLGRGGGLGRMYSTTTNSNEMREPANSNLLFP